MVMELKINKIWDMLQKIPDPEIPNVSIVEMGIVRGINYDDDSLTQRFISKARGLAKGIKVDGISNAMIMFPKCCSPIPGDEIIGYITRGKGVTIHRANCKNLPMKKENFSGSRFYINT